MHPALLLLADSRLPTGGHAHSGGIEAAVRRGDVRTADDVERFLAARVPTTGLVAAACAAAACALVPGPTAPRSERRAPPRSRSGHGGPSPFLDGDHGDRRGAPTARSVERGAPSATPGWGPWDAAVSARIPAAPLREVSRAQGRALVRTARATWPSSCYDALGSRPHQPLALGVVVAVAGGAPPEAAALAVHHLVGQVTTAAVRLLGLDPFALSGVHARALADARPVIAEAAERGVTAAAHDDPDRLPAASTPLPEVLAVHHAHRTEALFAS